MHKSALSLWNRRTLSPVIAILALLTLSVATGVHAAAPDPNAAVTLKPATPGVDEHLDALRVGQDVFTNVTVMTKTSKDIFFKHAHGFGNAKLRDLDRPTLLTLGYQLPPEEGEKKSVFTKSADKVFQSEAVTNLVSSKEFQKAQADFNVQLGEFLDQVTPLRIQQFVGAIIAFHLLFSLLCRMICVKAGRSPTPLIWLPFFKQIPLLRTAGISPAWLIPAVLITPLYAILYIWWSFRITAARDKHWIVAVMLLLPVTNILAFLYLALSGNGAPSESTSTVISLGNPQQPPKRAAA